MIHNKGLFVKTVDLLVEMSRTIKSLREDGIYSNEDIIFNMCKAVDVILDNFIETVLVIGDDSQDIMDEVIHNVECLVWFPSTELFDSEGELIEGAEGLYDYLEVITRNSGALPLKQVTA